MLCWLQVLPPIAYAHLPATNFNTRFVHVSLNKVLPPSVCCYSSVSTFLLGQQSAAIASDHISDPQLSAAGLNSLVPCMLSPATFVQSTTAVDHASKACVVTACLQPCFQGLFTLPSAMSLSAVLLLAVTPAKSYGAILSTVSSTLLNTSHKFP